MANRINPVFSWKLSMMRCVFFNIAAALLLLTDSAYASSFDSFTWIERGEYAQIYQEIEKTFSDELLPDIPEKEKPCVPSFHKYIARIGAFRNSFIVLIGYRERENDPKEYDLFRAFSYDRISRRKDEIQPEGAFFQWTFVGLAAFEPSVTPDVVFEYDDCVECESVRLLSSFMFDKKEKKWKIRIWQDHDSALMIERHRQPDDGPSIPNDFWVYDCLHTIADINSDGFADIAIRCRKRGEITKITTDETILHTIRKGVAKKIRVRDKKKIEQINTVLCKGQRSPLCK
jgi:hypothetical protein